MKNDAADESALNRPEPNQNRSSSAPISEPANLTGPNGHPSGESKPKRPLVDEFGNPLYHEHDEFGEWLTRDQSEEHHHPYGT